MTVTRLQRGLLVLGILVVAAGCYQWNGRPTERDGGVADGSMARDGGARDDAGLLDADAGTCAPLGSTRLCGSYCDEPCPDGFQACNSYYQLCQATDATSDPRGLERCHVSPDRNSYCYRGRLCVTDDEPRYEGPTWTGACVSDEYCRWLQTRPELSHRACRYTDGSVFVNGPPDHECAAGALAQNPFCGGNCGDRCPANPWGPPVTDPVGCVGRSETRGFGVCTMAGDERCTLGDPDGSRTAFDVCRAGLGILAGGEAIPCVCMLLSPVFVEEYADDGWAVSEQTCLAYQARYPDEVRCIPEDEL